MILLRCSPRVEKRERLQIELRLHLRPHIAKWASLSSSLSSSTSSSPPPPSSSSSSSCFLYVHIGPDIAKWARPVCSSFPHNNQFLNIKYKKEPGNKLSQWAPFPSMPRDTIVEWSLFCCILKCIYLHKFFLLLFGVTCSLLSRQKIWCCRGVFSSS